MTTTRCLSSRELIKPESVTHVLRQKCHPCPGLHRGRKNLKHEGPDDVQEGDGPGGDWPGSLEQRSTVQLCVRALSPGVRAGGLTRAPK